MASNSDEIQPFGGQHREPSAGGAGVLMAGTAGTSHPRQRQFPIHSQWPPAYLGFVPDALTEPLEIEAWKMFVVVSNLT